MRYLILVFIMPLILFACASPEAKDVDVAGKNFTQPAKTFDVTTDDVVKQLKEKLDSDPSDKKALYDLSQRYLDLKSIQLARETIQTALEQDPGNTQFKILLANTYSDEGISAEAEKIFNEIIGKEPENSDAYLSWGVMYFNLGVRKHDTALFDKAIEKYEKVLSMDEKNFKALFNIGLVYLLETKPEEARVAFQRAHEVDPGAINVIIHLAKLESSFGHWEKCSEYAKKGLKISDNPELVYLAGDAAYQMKKYDEAREYFEKFLTLNYIGPLDATVRAKLLEIQGIGKDK
jgi:tetratricopeptide (TPR) repeat protein